MQKSQNTIRLPQQSWGSFVLRSGLALLLIAIVSALFWHTRSFAALLWDDQLHLTHNPFLQPDSSGRFSHFWRHAYGQLYIPLAYNVWAVIYNRPFCFDADGNFSPAALHLLNVATHAVTSAGVFFLLYRLLLAAGGQVSRVRTSMAALIGALFFAVHPLQAESIAWISEFRGLLSSLLCVIAINLHVASSVVRAKAWVIALEATAVLAFAAALLSKPSATPLPLILGAIDIAILHRSRAQLLRLWPYFSLSIGAWLLTRGVQTSASGAYVPIIDRPLVAADAITFYLGKLVWPFALTTDYSRTPFVARSLPLFYFAWVVPAWIVALLYVRPNRVVITACLVFAISILPVLGIVPFAFQRLSTVADRYVYLGLIGPALLIAYMVLRDLRWAYVVVPAVALLAWRCVDQTLSWKNDDELWAHAARVNPMAAGALSNLANAAATRGDRAQAQRLFDRVIEIDPHRSNGYLGRAQLAEDDRDYSGAVAWSDRAASVEPDLAEPHIQAGAAYRLAGNRIEAINRYKRALQIQPDSSIALNDLGSIYLEAGMLDEADDLLDRAIRLDPRHTPALMNRAAVSLKRDDLQSYLKFMNQAIRVAGTDSTPLRSLGKFAISRKEWDAAHDCFERILERSPDDVDALNELGHALARLQRLDEAIACFEKALRLSPGQSAIENNLRAARQLQQRQASPPTPARQ